ncbi:MAG TPA: hypothetical protein PLR20_11685 [Syntrophales bacterium]|nr:hypothetical protein [Syntrophales bacterium]HOX93847.1 hypothetical protein [Syntrophales bacterium]HPI57015.1 hypothetical protein [Syntrophales bacterium]HPN23855.1 hypothetical protein [Syntrophales bacterium]HQM30002.1 hypothetical protein [Syntrophales bacterium]
MMSDRRTRVVFFIAAVLVLSLGAGSPERAFCDVTKELKKLSEEREKSVGYAKIAKVTFKKQPKKLTQAMLYYTDAKSIGNPIIQQLQTSMTSRSLKESQVRAMLSDDVQRLVQVNEKFRAFIESGETSNRALPGVAAMAAMAGPITDACVNLWKEYKDADRKKVDEMVRILEGYKWEDWDKL